MIETAFILETLPAIIIPMAYRLWGWSILKYLTLIVSVFSIYPVLEGYVIFRNPPEFDGGIELAEINFLLRVTILIYAVFFLFQRPFIVKNPKKNEIDIIDSEEYL